MATLKCKMCGGTIDFEQGTTVCTCEYCGTKQTLPKLDDDRKANLYDRANHFRRNNEYDKAMSIYEQILNEDPTDAESYWSIVLCRYGIEYVEDPSTHKRVPTVNRAQFTSVIADEDYKKALENADISQKVVYEEEAKAIDEIQKGILEISSKEEPFDVFICYKETDNNGRRTPDSVLANDLYHQLVQEGFKVFFSRITLEDKLGTAYEPYIFAALNSSKVMVVLGTKPEYFNAVWVKNEWSRYLALIRKGEKKMLIPAYKDMDPYDLPEEFSHLQAQDMTKLGFMQDLIRGIKKIIGDNQAKQDPKQTVSVGANVEALLKRGNMAIEDGEWIEAKRFFDEALNYDAECAEAYLGMAMADHKLRYGDLSEMDEDLSIDRYYSKAKRYASGDLRMKMEEWEKRCNERINARKMAEEEEKKRQEKDELERKEIKEKNLKAIKKRAILLGIALIFVLLVLIFILFIIPAVKYSKAINLKNNGQYIEAMNTFSEISSFRDSDSQIHECVSSAYNQALSDMQNGQYQSAIDVFISIGDFEDSSYYSQLSDALLSMQNGQYDEAISKLSNLSGLEETADAVELYSSDEPIEAIRNLTIASQTSGTGEEVLNEMYLELSDLNYIQNVDVGDYIVIGEYDDYPIVWLVLERDGNDMLLLSVFSVSKRVYDDDFGKAMYIGWEQSSLRTWLNDVFYNDAFSDEQKNMIITATEGYMAQDNVFLLDERDIITYFSTPLSKCCPSRTSYVYEDWWLAQSGYIYQGNVECVGTNGNFTSYAANTERSVRPAMWISVS